LISGPIRFASSEDDAKRLAQELQGHNDELARLRIERDALRAEVEALRADAATDRKLVQAAEKFIHPVLQELQFERGHGSLAVHNLRLVLIEAMKANAKHAEIDAARAAQGE
jgi:outer membrane murein-binding lipoprotein Lpp